MNQALLLVDIQNDYFTGGAMQLAGMEKAAANAAGLLKKFRDRNLPVYHIRHIAARAGATFFLPDTKGSEISETVAPLESEPVIIKHFPNSFRETDLYKRLRQNNISDLVICGAMSHMCIDATTRAAFDLGFKCVVAEDACATRNLEFKGETVPAAAVHAAFMAALKMPYAEIAETARILL